MGDGGKKSGRGFGLGFLNGMLGPLGRLPAVFQSLLSPLAKLFQAAMSAAFQLVKFGLIAGVVGTAVAGLAAAIAKTLPLISQLVTTAIAASGALLLIPGAIAAGITAMAAFKLGTQGVSTALKWLGKGDLQKLDEALKKLAPNAQLFVKELARLKPIFDKLRLNIQNALFAGWAKSLKDIGGTLLPVVMKRLTEMAAVLNGAVLQGFNFVLDKAVQLDIGNILGNSNKSVSNLAAGFRPLLRIITDVTTVSSEAFAKLTGGFGRMVSGWADDVAGFRASGEMSAWITDSFAAIKDLSGLLLDVTGIIRGVFRAAGDGGGLFSFFDRINRLVNSDVGQAALTSIFDSLFKVAEALTPVLVTLLQAIVPVATALSHLALAFAGPLQTLAAGLGQGLAALEPGLSALAPILSVVGAFLPTLGQGISTLLAAFAPGAISLVTSLVGALSVLTQSAGPLGAALGGIAAALGPVLITVAQALTGLIVGLAPAVQLLASAFGVFLQAALPALGPLVAGVTAGINAVAGFAGVLGQSLGSVLAALVPLLVPVVQILGTLIVALAPAAVAILQALSAALEPLARVAPLVGTAIADLVTALAPLLEVVGPLLALLLGELADALSGVSLILGPTIKLFAGEFLKALVQVLPYIAAAGAALLPMLADAGVKLATAFLPLVPLFAQLMELYANELAANLPIVTDLFRQLIPVGVLLGQMLAANLIDMLVALMPVMPQIISSLVLLSQSLLQLIVAVAPILPPLFQLGTLVSMLILNSGLLQLAIFALIVGVQLITGFFQILTAVARALISPIADGKKGVEAFGSAVSQKIGEAVGIFRGLGSTVLTAISGFGSLLYNAGKSLIQGLINGIQGMVSSLKSSLGFITKMLPDWKGPLDKDKVILRPAGVAVMKGFQAGLESQIGNIRASLGGLTMQMPAMAGAGGGAGAVAPMVNVTVVMANKVMDDLVENVIVSRPAMVASATDAGHQAKGFIGTRNRLVKR